MLVRCTKLKVAGLAAAHVHGGLSVDGLAGVQTVLEGNVSTCFEFQVVQLLWAWLPVLAAASFAAASAAAAA